MELYFVIGLLFGLTTFSVCMKVVGQSCDRNRNANSQIEPERDLPPKYEVLEAPPPYDV